MAALRVLLLSLLLYRAQFLIDPSLVARPDEVILRRGILNARAALGVLAVALVLRSLRQSENLGLRRVPRLLELTTLGHVVRLIQGRALPNARSRPTELGALTEGGPAVGARLRALGSGVLPSDLGVSLRKQLLLVAKLP